MGIRATRHITKAQFNELKSLVKQRNIDAVIQYLNCLCNGWQCDNKDPEIQRQTSELAKKYSEQSSQVMAILGFCYLYGIGVDQNQKEAFKLFQQAAEKGNGLAKYNIASCYWNGTGGVNKDKKEAVKWFKDAAKHRHPRAMVALATLYRNGTGGVDQNLEEAFKLFQQAAEAGDSLAMFNIAFCYYNGLADIVEKNQEEAVRWYIKSAEQGCSAAMVSVGISYHDGIGVKQNSVQAVRWLQEAAKENDEGALFNLAVCYAEGNGVKQWQEQAFQHFKHAADLGSVESMLELSRRYEKGDGCPQDINAAFFWVKLAIKNGYKPKDQEKDVIEKYGEALKKSKSKPNDTLGFSDELEMHNYGCWDFEEPSEQLEALGVTQIFSQNIPGVIPPGS